MKGYDVVVVGAGPAGSTAARTAVLSGASTLMIEEHAASGSPVQCAGLISSKTLEVCDLKPGPFIYQKIRGAHIFSPDGTRISIGGEKERAFVIDRKMFDRLLLKNAADAGADVMMKAKVLGFEDSGGKKVLKVISGDCHTSITAGVIIGADGVQGSTARWSGLGPVQKVLSGVQVESAYDVSDMDHVEVFTGSDAPGFFAWAVPLNNHSARIGLCIDPAMTRMSAYEHLVRFLRTNPRMLSSKGCSDLVVGGIPLGPPPSTAAKGIIITGDAAGQVKPTSGGGIYMGTICASIAGEVAASAAQRGDTSASALMEYDRRWRDVVGKELAVGMRIHRVFGKLSDDDLNQLLGFFGEAEMLDLINKYGDMDHPSILLGKMLTRAKGMKMLGVARIVMRAMMG